jgi:3-oxoacyl-[acyl-carrier-protein] synthase-3
MVSTFNEIVEKAGKTPNDVALLIPHQANKRIIEYAAQHTGLDMDRVYVNVNRWGNTSAASVPIAFCEAIEKGKISGGDLIALVAFGAGLTWAGALVQMPKVLN